MRAANQAVLADPEHRFGNNLDYEKEKRVATVKVRLWILFCYFLVCSVFVGGRFFWGGGLSCAGKQFKIIEEDKDTSPNDYPTLHSHSSPPLRARFFFNKTKEQLLNKTLRCTGRRAGTLGLQALH